MSYKITLPIFLEPAYRLTKLISDGKYTQTFFAVDEGEYPFTPCIVQRISSHLSTLDNVEKKVQILRQLKNYTHIPKLISYVSTSEYFYLVFEYFDGINLKELLSKQTFDENQIWKLLIDVLPILEVLHTHQLIHCDIKPENIILYKNQEITQFVIVDFAAAQIVGADNYFGNNLISGSPEYIAPEQLNCKPVFSSDLYSLGVTCIHLLTQISPFHLFDTSNNQWVWRHYLQSPISTRLSYILDKLVNQDIKYRFQSVDEVIQAMGISRSNLTIHLKENAQQIQAPNQISNSYTLKLNSYLTSAVNSVAMHPSAKILGSAHENKTAYIWDLETKQVLYSLRGHLQSIKSVAFSPDGKLVATGSDDKTLKLWNLDNYEQIHTLGHKHAVKSVAFSPDSKLIASGSWDKTVKLWDIATGQEICVLTGHKLQVSAVAFSQDGSLIASASFDKTAYLWKLTQSQNNHLDCTLHYIFSSHTWAVTCVAFSPDGKILATGSDDNSIKLWDTSTGREIATLSGHSWSITALAFKFTEDVLVSASKDKTIKLWHYTEDTKEIITLSGHTDSVTCIAITNNSNTIIASGSTDKTIKLWQ
ncbi:MAG: serine/threonine protein kinase [Calothrix sp. C42_A2020_038]|nr:serine/threonine protein kinase [Calothrix sp. C42_A2020_038]